MKIKDVIKLHDLNSITLIKVLQETEYTVLESFPVHLLNERYLDCEVKEFENDVIKF